MYSKFIIVILCQNDEIKIIKSESKVKCFIKIFQKNIFKSVFQLILINRFLFRKYVRNN